VVPVLYTASESFGTSSDGWSKYVAWSQLTHLRGVVSLDESLCPNVFRELEAEDWNHNVQADLKTHLFYDVEHVVARVVGKPVNVLAIIEEATDADVASFNDPRFEFCGFDLLDESFAISALTNCGGFERAFQPGDLSEWGLLTDYAHACTVRDRLQVEYPDDPHANCRMFAIWKMM
jgi:hypothetical protein